MLGEVRKAQFDLVRSTNATVIQLYWRIGRLIVERGAVEGYGAQVIKRLALDITTTVPGQRGFSPRSLQYMRAFAVAWPDPEKCAAAAALSALGPHPHAPRPAG